MADLMLYGLGANRNNSGSYRGTGDPNNTIVMTDANGGTYTRSSRSGTYTETDVNRPSGNSTSRSGSYTTPTATTNTATTPNAYNYTLPTTTKTVTGNDWLWLMLPLGVLCIALIVSPKSDK